MYEYARTKYLRHMTGKQKDKSKQIKGRYDKMKS